MISIFETARRSKANALAHTSTFITRTNRLEGTFFLHHFLRYVLHVRRFCRSQDSASLVTPAVNVTAFKRVHGAFFHTAKRWRTNFRTARTCFGAISNDLFGAFFFHQPSDPTISPSTGHFFCFLNIFIFTNAIHGYGRRHEISQVRKAIRHRQGHVFGISIQYTSHDHHSYTHKSEGRPTPGVSRSIASLIFFITPNDHMLSFFECLH
mmetsp:Transcript_37894/g.55842  ORF Transcript_37894/g.55842 Transcript_37894/m.55842 type:complete len:209 (+) Transcript_37894:1277-1903(+)